MIGDAVLFYQRNKIGRRVARQRGLGKVRVGGDEIVRLAMQVGKVAAPAAGDQNLFADTLRPRLPASMAHIRPAAPAPRTITSNCDFMDG